MGKNLVIGQLSFSLFLTGCHMDSKFTKMVLITRLDQTVRVMHRWNSWFPVLVVEGLNTLTPNPEVSGLITAKVMILW